MASPLSPSTVDLTEGLPEYTQIQPHGALLVLSEPDCSEPDYRVVQASCNVNQFFGVSAQDLVGQPLTRVIPEEQCQRLRCLLDGAAEQPIELVKIVLPRFDDNAQQAGSQNPSEPCWFDVLFHRNPDGVPILEFEPTGREDPVEFLDFYQLIKVAAVRLRQQSTLQDLCQIGVDEVRWILGFDRVMIYQFSPMGHGWVLAESKAPELTPSFLDLRFPDEDTRPCRELLVRADYTVRSIVDSGAEGVDLYPSLHPETEERVDLHRAQLRSPATCHRMYLQNMDRVRSTVVMPLMNQDQLWGLVSCQNHQAVNVPYDVRQACEFLGRVMSLELSSHVERQEYMERQTLQDIQNRLLEQISLTDSLTDELLTKQQDWLDITRSTGVIVVNQEQLASAGKVPTLPQINGVLTWIEAEELGSQSDDYLYVTDQLPEVYPPAQEFMEVASGLLLMTLSAALKIYVLWFRPETLQAVDWAGDPLSVVETDENGEERLCPRGSFVKWTELVRGRSIPWRSAEIGTARSLRGAIVNIVLRQASAKAKLTTELARSNSELNRFAYVTSHDLQEPLNLVANYVQLLEMRYGDRLDEDAREFINYAVEGVNHMQTLIDDLLDYSRVGGQQTTEMVDLNEVLSWVLRHLQERIQVNQAQVIYETLPMVKGNRMQLIQVFQNLLGNAIKFRGTKAPLIQIQAIQKSNLWEFSVADNGIGLESKFGDRIFQVFQRLHTREEYPGTGIGLAICKKIVNQHGGEIWVNSIPGNGATFHFTIPILRTD